MGVAVLLRHGEGSGVIDHLLAQAIREGAAPGAATAVGVLRLEDGHVGEDEALPDAHGHAFRLKRLHDGVTGDGGLARPADGGHIDAVGVVVPVVQVAFGLNRRNIALDASQLGGEHRRVLLERLKVASHLGELRATKGGGQVVAAVHPAKRVGVVVAGFQRGRRLAEAPELQCLLVHLLAVCDEHAALARAEAFVLVEAECGAVAQLARVDSVELGAVPLAGVLDELQVIFRGDFAKGVKIAGQTVQVDGDDGLGLGRDKRLDLVHVHVHRRIVDIDEDGYGIVVQNAGRARGPRVGGHDDLVARADARRHHAHVQGRCAAVCEDCILVARIGGKLLLERLAVRTEGVRAAIECRQYHLVVYLIHRWPCLNCPLLDDWGTAVDCQFRHVVLLEVWL